MMPTLKLLFDLAVQVDKPIGIDAGALGRRYIPIIGGTVGGAYTGRVLPGGGDWQTIWPDGRLDISAHYVLDIDAHGTVEVQSDGVRTAAPEVLAALARGEVVDPSLYYFRTAVRLRTAAPGLLRLNAILAIATGARLPGQVRLGVYEVG
jgi:Protein of unknown function (DUF3237)